MGRGCWEAPRSTRSSVPTSRRSTTSWPRSTHWPPLSRLRHLGRPARATEWDSITAGAWYDAQGLSPIARTPGDLHRRDSRGTDGRGVIPAPFTIQTCGVGAALFSEAEGGAQTTRFVGGTAQLPDRLTAQLTDHLILDAQVQTIEYSDDHVTVSCRGGGSFGARWVIVAIAPALAGRILYDPPRMSNDACIPGQDAVVLLAFLEGEQARVVNTWSATDRREALTAELVRIFGPQAAHPVAYIDGEWSERPWTMGCYNANKGPLVWTTLRSGADTAHRPHPLGVDRHRHPLERLPGRCRRCRGTRCGRSVFATR